MRSSPSTIRPAHGVSKSRQCVDDLAATRQLVRIDEEVDANLEAAEIHRRVNQAGGPAVLSRA